LSRNDNGTGRLCSSGGQLALQDSDAFGARQGNDAQLGNILHCVSEIRTCVHQIALNVTQNAAHAKELGLVRAACARELVNSGRSARARLLHRCRAISTSSVFFDSVAAAWLSSATRSSASAANARRNSSAFSRTKSGRN
jgi:hypothetical protein